MLFHWTVWLYYVSGIRPRQGLSSGIQVDVDAGDIDDLDVGDGEIDDVDVDAGDVDDLDVGDADADADVLTAQKPL